MKFQIKNVKLIFIFLRFLRFLRDFGLLPYFSIMHMSVLVKAIRGKFKVFLLVKSICVILLIFNTVLLKGYGRSKLKYFKFRGELFTNTLV